MRSISSGTGGAVISVDDIECTVDDMEEGLSCAEGAGMKTR
jgi:hypothetical protein